MHTFSAFSVMFKPLALKFGENVADVEEKNEKRHQNFNTKVLRTHCHVDCDLSLKVDQKQT